MENIHKILLIGVLLTLLTLFSLKLYNTLVYSRIKVREINSADINISTTKIEELIKNFQKYLKCPDLTIEYGVVDNYSRIFNMLNKKKKKITIPRWVMPSVGYEIDYLLASIWYNTKRYQNDKELKKFNLFWSVIPKLAYFIYSLTTVISMMLFIMYFFFSEDRIMIEGIFMWLIRIPIFQALSFLTFFIIISCLYFSTKGKNWLETKYEREIVSFVDSECIGYKTDIIAARVYSLEFNKLNFEIFRFNQKTENTKFLGPFVCI